MTLIMMMTAYGTLDVVAPEKNAEARTTQWVQPPMDGMDADERG